MNIAKRIVFIRKTNNLTQAEFGKKLGVSQDVIFNLEKERVQPKNLFLDHLCTIFNVNKEWLLFDKGETYCINIKKNLSNKLKDMRKSKGLTQNKLATILNTATSVISDVERGARNPSKKLAIKLADFFNTDPMYWLDIDAEVKKEQLTHKEFSSLKDLVKNMIEDKVVTLDNLYNLNNTLDQLILNSAKIEIYKQLKQRKKD